MGLAELGLHSNTGVPITEPKPHARKADPSVPALDLQKVTAHQARAASTARAASPIASTKPQSSSTATSTQLPHAPPAILGRSGTHTPRHAYAPTPRSSAEALTMLKTSRTDGSSTAGAATHRQAGLGSMQARRGRIMQSRSRFK